MSPFMQQATAIPNITIQGLPTMQMTNGVREIPKVKNTQEAKEYPSAPNTQDVLLDANDEYIAYFRQMDANGFPSIERVRCIPEPEMTQQQVDDQRYVTLDRFATFEAETKEALKNVQQSIYDALVAVGRDNRTNRNNFAGNRKSVPRNAQGNSYEQKSGGSVSGDGVSESGNQANAIFDGSQ